MGWDIPARTVRRESQGVAGGGAVSDKRHRIRFEIEGDGYTTASIECPYEGDDKRPCAVLEPNPLYMPEHDGDDAAYAPMQPVECWVQHWFDNAGLGETGIDGRIVTPWIDIDYRNEGGPEDSYLVLVPVP